MLPAVTGWVRNTREDAAEADRTRTMSRKGLGKVGFLLLQAVKLEIVPGEEDSGSAL
jgi:hypothetical protein